MPVQTLERRSDPVGIPALIGQARPNVIVADIGGTWTRMAIGGDRIHPENIIKYRTPQNYNRMITELGNQAVTLTDGRKIDAFGFGIAGQITDGVITKAGMLTEYGFVGKPVVADAADIMGVSNGRSVGTNDVRAAAKAEQTARLRAYGDEMKAAALFTISTGFAGSLITRDSIIPDEAGHHFLKTGAFCGCGLEGCIEAHVSGSGIEKKFGIRGENIPEDSVIWNEVRGDLSDGMDMTLTRYQQEMGISPQTAVFYGSVALNAPQLLDSLEAGLLYRRGVDTPDIAVAVYGNDSGLHGSYFDAIETL